MKSLPNGVNVWFCFVPVGFGNNFHGVAPEGKRGDAFKAVISAANARVDKERHPGIPLEEKGEVKILVASGNTETVLDLRDCGIANRHLVVAVDDPVTIDILVFDIPGHVPAERSEECSVGKECVSTC